MKIYLVKVIVRYFLLLKRLQYIQQNAKFPAFLLERKYYYVSHFIIFLFFYGKEKRTRWDIGGGNKVERYAIDCRSFITTCDILSSIVKFLSCMIVLSSVKYLRHQPLPSICFLL